MSNANGVNTPTTSDPVGAGLHIKLIMITHLNKAEVSETVLVGPPKLFGPKSGKYKVLKLLNLYEVKQTPRTYFEKLDYWNVDF